MNESISVIDSVEILPLENTEISPFLTKVKIKVFHLGENRNHSYIDRNTAINMAKTLRGNPIVARYREEKGDFTDHGEEIIINDKGFNVLTLTKPYGFVDLNAKVWFEDFEDFDPNVKQTFRHTYLVTEGMVWTEQYKELQNTILDGGRPQSMELHENVQGQWSNSINPNYEIFIINDAIITKLCALGEDVEPCFLGANIVPEFNLYNEEGFVKELLELKKKFQYALNINKGGVPMENAQAPVAEKEVTEIATNFSNEKDKVDKTVPEKNEKDIEEFAKKEKEDNTDEKPQNKEDKPEQKEDNSDKKPDQKEDNPDKKEKEDEEDKKKYELLQTEFEELKSKFALLEEENKNLVAFKKEIEDKQKDEMIASFYMLSDEDKKDVITNKDKYSLNDIKAQLSIICVDKKVDFSLGKQSDDTVVNTVKEAPVVYNLNAHEADTLPAWLKAVDAIHAKNN